MNKILVFAGIATLVQAVGQLIFTSLAISQYFCLIDFLREIPILLYIKILYFYNPDVCGNRINIGYTIEGIPNQAFVLLTQEPFTAFRTFVINSTSLGLSILWIITSVFFMMGGAKNTKSRHIRWPWTLVTVSVCLLDLVATVTYCNDTFHTRTLSDMMNFIGGMVSGAGGVNISTAWASWLMVIIYSRLVVLFILNMFMIILVVVDCNAERTKYLSSTSVQVEAPPETEADVSVVSSPPPPPPPPPPLPILQAATATQAETQTSIASTSGRDVEEASMPSDKSTKIPRPGISQSFRRMKTLLFKRSESPDVRSKSNPGSLDGSPNRSPQAQHVELDKKRAVNFPENLLSLPQRLENMIAEQQRRLDKAVIDTAGRHSPPRTSQSMPQLTTETQPDVPNLQGRRGTTAELQSQLPWAYIPASAHRMRDQLPPDEDLPPVPLPDYTAIQPFRKASVHRAASSLSSLTQKKDYALSQSSRQHEAPAKPAKFKTGSHLQLLPIFIETNDK
ncbi:uncharacterized protein LOC101740738 isoform X1 [Bombyx mori]|uniref:Uncharacterized protein n=1 Tax=Bombyx mori TaxID=7091 RepID=A0A8R2GA40_BOMMO|nr:uncharacterized protein LOC101740738 isoform X1 [Bombyx mori]